MSSHTKKPREHQAEQPSSKLSANASSLFTEIANEQMPKCPVCGREFVERDENGVPVRWAYCHDCPYKIVSAQNILDEETSQEGGSA